MNIELNVDSPHIKSYKFQSNARRAIEKFEDDFKPMDFRWVMSVNSDGRFVPLIMLNEKNEHELMLFVENGFMVTR
tara:strand:- start:89 stop:316 length:228 start_codon:yes stop_codon:yes gene_type:complete